jgi:predicted porin
VTLRGEVANVDLTGEAVGLARFELTDGRGAGTSYLWGVDGQYQINDYLRATVAYDGRAPADAPTVNTFRINLSAQF